MNKLLIGSCILAVLSGVWIGVRKASQGEAVPRLRATSTIESRLNIHGSKHESLTVCGRSFPSPQGAPPYYLVVSDLHGILFVYEPAAGDRRLVYCDTNACQFIEVNLQNTTFGSQIGYWEATGGKMGDVVESVISNRVSLLSKRFNYSERVIFDLEMVRFSVTERDGLFTRSYLEMPTNYNQGIRKE